MSLSRQVEIAKWAVLVLRLLFVADVAHHAKEQGEPLPGLESLADDAASETKALSFSKLLRWVRGKAVRLVWHRRHNRPVEAPAGAIEAMEEGEGPR